MGDSGWIQQLELIYFFKAPTLILTCWDCLKKSPVAPVLEFMGCRGTNLQSLFTNSGLWSTSQTQEVSFQIQSRLAGPGTALQDRGGGCGEVQSPAESSYGASLDNKHREISIFTWHICIFFEVLPHAFHVLNWQLMTSGIHFENSVMILYNIFSPWHSKWL